jgi:hypothetical protein
MNEDELTFYYFNLHDFDKNQLLDGLELLVSMNHLLDDPAAVDDHKKKQKEQPAYNPEDPHLYYSMLAKQNEWNKKFKKDSGMFVPFSP